jgi:hypothetical protein
MAKTLAQLNTAILANLEDDGTIFTDTTTELKESLKEFSYYSPWIGTRILTVRDKSRDIDISNLDALNIDYAIYPVRLRDGSTWLDDANLDDNRRNVEWEADFLRMNIDTVPSAEATGTLTGTVTLSDGSTAVSGSSTLFTSELRIGYYIRKSSGSTWYRIASITDDTNLVLAKACVTADDGADTEDSTVYWQSDVYVRCGEVHKVTEQTDLAGAIDSGAAAGYAAGSWAINVDGLGTGTIEKNTLFTIAGCDGLYRVTADATIGTNEATLFIEPCLREIAAENAVVTFKPSSLKPYDEVLLARLAAARLAMYHIGLGRTAISSAITASALINSSTDSMSARLTQAATDLGTVRTHVASLLSGAATKLATADTTIGTALTTLGLGKTAAGNIVITDSIGDADTQIDLAITDINNARGTLATSKSAIADEVTSIGAEIVLAIADLASARALNNTITVSGGAESQLHASANAELNAAMARINEINAILEKSPALNEENILSGNELNIASLKLQHARAIISAYGSQGNVYTSAGGAELSAARTYISEAQGIISEYSNAVSGLLSSAGREVSIANGYLAQSSGYQREVNSHLSISNIITSYQRWGRELYETTIRELKRLQKPKMMQTYSRS